MENCVLAAYRPKKKHENVINSLFVCVAYLTWCNVNVNLMALVCEGRRIMLCALHVVQCYSSCLSCHLCDFVWSFARHVHIANAISYLCCSQLISSLFHHRELASELAWASNARHSPSIPSLFNPHATCDMLDA